MRALESANVDTDYFFHVVHTTMEHALVPLELTLVGRRPESAPHLVQSMLLSSLSFSLQAIGLSTVEVIVIVNEALSRVDVTFASNDSEHFCAASSMALN